TMVSFINNMTHEFKTPISTVALAAEAIMRSDQISDAVKVERYARMIKDENTRMRNQAEKILQMAALEEGDFELKLTDVDIHEAIRQAVENIKLHIESRQGEVIINLNAKSHFIKADRDHLNSIIYNLLDNANKYSKEKPKIDISTKNFGQGIVVTVSDSGIGIKENDLKMVFKKYYRVASGNIHDVKGFGLGLSYVKLLVEAQKGSIKISSKSGEGTVVEFWLPINSSQ
ncbi:MAG: HAMP domain-containing sensor histidine kinase, partial [Candidatus Zixiibacteriota bacterium]